MEQLQVVLANEDSFREYLFSIFVEELERAKKEAGTGKKFLILSKLARR